ncbi:MAG: tetratricopeptide repeat protein, partial [Deltaproteobacteria bacterium]|nr:tetratricopeptide repeat protein [Deltaproteobacteria bacterium]
LNAHIDRAWDRMAAGDLGAALRSAERAAALAPDSPEVHNLLGYVLAAHGRFEEAIEHYKQAIELDESYVEAMLNAAEIMLHPLHDWDAAIEMIDQAIEWIEDDEELADALLLKAEALLGKGQREEALATLRGIPQKHFENSGIEFALGRLWFELGDLDKAEHHLKRAIELAPENSDAHYFLGLCYEQRKDRMGMILEFLKAREIDLNTPSGSRFWLSPRDLEERTREAIRKLPPQLAKVLDGALVIVVDLPGAEVVAEGVDPRIPLMVDGISEDGEAPRVGRVFIYRRNIERIGPTDESDFLAQALMEEIRAVFPELSQSDGKAGDNQLMPYLQEKSGD